MKTEKTAFLIFLIIILSLSVYAVTIAGGSSSYSFSVDNCSVSPTTNLSCGAETLRYECYFGNIAFIDRVHYRVQGTNYLTTQNSTNPNQFYLFYNKPLELTSNNDPITFDRQTVTDTDNKSINANILVTNNHSCNACQATYTDTPITFCATNDTRIVERISSNETCSPSYNQTQYCNYCNQNLQPSYGICTQDNIQTLDWNDANYNSCCLQTGLPSDCSINSFPYNTQTNVSCSYLVQDFQCNADSQPTIQSKINLNCELPNNEEYNCIVNVYQERPNQTSILLSTTPEYKKTSNSILSIASEGEERTSFTTNQKILNAYYTDKQLRPEDNFKLQVQCTNNNTIIKYEKIIQPVYSTPDWGINRIVWAGNNAPFIIVTIIVLIVIVTFVGYLYFKLRRRR